MIQLWVAILQTPSFDFLPICSQPGYVSVVKTGNKGECSKVAATMVAHVTCSNTGRICQKSPPSTMTFPPNGWLVLLKPHSRRSMTCGAWAGIRLALSKMTRCRTLIIAAWEVFGKAWHILVSRIDMNNLDRLFGGFYLRKAVVLQCQSKQLLPHSDYFLQGCWSRCCIQRLCL